MQQWPLLSLFAAPAPDIGCVGWILCWHQYTNKKLMLISTIVMLWSNLLVGMRKVLGSVPELCRLFL